MCQGPQLWTARGCRAAWRSRGLTAPPSRQVQVVHGRDAVRSRELPKQACDYRDGSKALRERQAHIRAGHWLDRVAGGRTQPSGVGAFQVHAGSCGSSPQASCRGFSVLRSESSD